MVICQKWIDPTEHNRCLYNSTPHIHPIIVYFWGSLSIPGTWCFCIFYLTVGCIWCVRKLLQSHYSRSHKEWWVLKCIYFDELGFKEQYFWNGCYIFKMEKNNCPHITHLFDCSGDALVVNEIVRSYMYLFDISNMNVIPLSKIHKTAVNCPCSQQMSILAVTIVCFNILG